MSKIRWGILSTADIGRRSVGPAIQKSRNGELVAVASRSLERAQQYAADLNIPRAYGSYDELLADPDIDAIYNPLPNHLHGVWSIKAAEAGKAVLCEKPLAADAAEAQQMLDAFRAHNALLAEAFMYRYHPMIEVIRRMVHEGAIGTVKIIRASFTFWMDDERHATDIRTQPNMAGGSLMDVGTYPVSLMRLITEEEPIRAQAFAVWAESGTDDNMVGTLQFPSGVLGHFDCGFRAAYQNSADILGDTGRIYIESAFVHNENEEYSAHIWRGDNHEEMRFPAVNHYTLIVEDFAEAMQQVRPTRYPPQDAVNQMRALDMLYASAKVK
jgi:predicted dehydrogenase